VLVYSQYDHFLLLIICPDDWPGVVIILLLYNTFRILGSVMYPRSSRKSTEFLSRGLQNFESWSPHVPSMSWNDKITPDFLSSQLGLSETSSKSFVLDPSPLRRDQSLTTPLSSPTLDYNHIITPPSSASLSSHSNMGRHDPEDAPLAAGIPTLSRQSRFATALSIPGQSLVGRGNSSRSRVTSWSRWIALSPHPYITLSKTNEGQASVPDRLPLSVSPLSTRVSMYLRVP
jgi:hypothetical protein